MVLQERSWGVEGCAHSTQAEAGTTFTECSPLCSSPLPSLRAIDQVNSLLFATPAALTLREEKKAHKSILIQIKDETDLKIFRSRLFPWNLQVPLSKVNTPQPNDY